MYKTQIELELQIAYEWARQGNIERTLLHIDLAKKYLTELAEIIERKSEEEKDFSGDEMRYWQHSETGRVVGTPEKPPGEWAEITKAQYRQTVENRS
jgi:hypothetical protein